MNNSAATNEQLSTTVLSNSTVLARMVPERMEARHGHSSLAIVRLISILKRH